ncbi:MAG: DUF436 family protein, partial [Oscillospiraceae bacterium]|nr:DUF436 family protein [Oscillospiraceae bacterium]
AAEKYGLEMVNVKPQLKAGGSFSVAAWNNFAAPCAVEKIQAHAGIDIGAAMGTPIVASDGGNVIVSTYDGGYGNYVMINHGDGRSTLYGHMSSRAVSVGQTVTKGQVIGYVGSTGNSTGPHIHFEIRVNGGTVNPLKYFSGYTVA